MPTQPCPTCGQTFTRVASYNYHIEHKVCSKDNQKQCPDCLYVFSSKQKKDEHIQRQTCCKKQSSIDKQIELERLKLQKEQTIADKAKYEANKEQTILEQMKITVQRETLSCQQLQQVNIGCTSVNVTVNIHPVPYGTEDWRKIQQNNPDFVSRLAKYPENSIQELIKIIHCNDRYPEFHTVYFSKRKPKIAMISDGERFVEDDADKIIDELYERNKDRIEEPLCVHPSDFDQAVHDKHDELTQDEKFVKRVKREVKAELQGMERKITQGLRGANFIKA